MLPLDARPSLSKNVAATVGTPVMLKGIPGLAIMWLGILGGAITLFANLLAPLDMADWAWWIVGYWQEGAPALWDWLAGWLGLEVPSLLVPALNIAVSLLLTAIGSRIRDHGNQGQVGDVPFYHLVGGIVVVFAIGYIIVAGPSQSTSAGGAPADAPLVIFLAAATASFSSPIAGRGNFTKRLWLILASLVILLALNEATKFGLDMMTSQDPS